MSAANCGATACRALWIIALDALPTGGCADLLGIAGDTGYPAMATQLVANGRQSGSSGSSAHLHAARQCGKGALGRRGRRAQCHAADRQCLGRRFVRFFDRLERRVSIWRQSGARDLDCITGLRRRCGGDRRAKAIVTDDPNWVVHPRFAHANADARDCDLQHVASGGLGVAVRRLARGYYLCTR